MQNKITHKIKKEQAGVKVVNFMKFELNMSTRLTRKLVLGGYVTVNGKKAKNKYGQTSKKESMWPKNEEMLRLIYLR